MNKPPRIAVQGDTIEHEKTKYVAAQNSNSSTECTLCAHCGDIVADTPACATINKTYDCRHVIWLTEPDFILHRLTS